MGVDCETDNSKVSDNAHSKTSVPRVVKLELLHKVFEVKISPLCEYSFTGFNCVNVNAKELKMQCYLLLNDSEASIGEENDLSFLLHGCQTARASCRCNRKNRIMNNGR